MKTIGLSVFGVLLVVSGMALTLGQWDMLAAVIKACAGPVLAVAGLIVLFAASAKKQ